MNFTKICLLASCTLCVSFSALSVEAKVAGASAQLKEGTMAKKASNQSKSASKKKSVPLDYVSVARRKGSSMAAKKTYSLALPKINGNILKKPVAPVLK